jgi:prepilin-type N-terminal cleavage/methylation domain-containing protein
MDCRLPIFDCRLNDRRPRAARRRGFSFTEVLFAVMVMGIGFIMVAAMFPVTIRNQQSTLEETVAAATARSALTYLQRNDIIQMIADDKNDERKKAWDRGYVLSISERKPDGKIKHDDAPVWDALAGNMILPDNPRVAWVPLFRKADIRSGLAQVFIFVVQNRHRPQYQLDIPNPTPRKPSGSDVYRTAAAGEDNHATISRSM